MSLSFGPTALPVTPTNAKSVEVTERDSSVPAKLSAPVEVDERGRISFTVAESGQYTVTSTNVPASSSSSRNVSLTGEAEAVAVEPEATEPTPEEVAPEPEPVEPQPEATAPEEEAAAEEEKKPAPKKRAPAKKKDEDTES